MNKTMSMRIFYLMSIILIVCSCETKSNLEQEAKNDLAKVLGADEHGMKTYVMAFLKRGPNRSQDSLTAIALQQAHLDNINRMADEGKLIVAGPFLDDGEIRGIYIFNVSTIEEAAQLTNSDPAIKAGSLVMELHPWYGSAALMKVNEIHKKIEQKKNSCI